MYKRYRNEYFERLYKSIVLLAINLDADTEAISKIRIGIG